MAKAKSPYETTDVPISRTQEHLRQLLKKYGIDQIALYQAWPKFFAIEFIRLETSRDGDKILRVRIAGKPVRSEADPDQELRRIGRMIFYNVKAKLEAVEAGLVTFEQEFLPHIVLPSGRTLYVEMLPDLPNIYAGTMQLALPGPREER